MSKLDQLRAAGQATAAESMGVRPQGVGSPAGFPGKVGPPERLRGVTPRSDVATVPVSKLERDPEQPREEFDTAELDRLADSLKQHGQVQPIAAWWDEEASVYRIAAGERRWRAARMAGLEALAVTILPSRPKDGKLIVLQLVENMHRSDLRPIEQARAFRKAIDANGWTANRLASELAITESWVSKILALLNLPEPIQAKVESGEMSGATAYVLSKIEDPEAQAEVAERVVAEGLSRAETIEAVRRTTPAKKSAGSKGRGVARQSKPVVKTFRVPEGKVTVELRKGIDADVIAALLIALGEGLRGQGQEAA
jgi:ParB family chromosome partitioning protein